MNIYFNQFAFTVLSENNKRSSHRDATMELQFKVLKEDLQKLGVNELLFSQNMWLGFQQLMIPNVAQLESFVLLCNNVNFR